MSNLLPPGAPAAPAVVDPTQALVPDYATIDPTLVTAGQPALSPEDIQNIQGKAQHEAIFNRMIDQPIGYSPLTGGLSEVAKGVGSALTPVAETVAQSDTFRPALRDVAAEFAAGQRAAQLDQAAAAQAQAPVEAGPVPELATEIQTEAAKPTVHDNIAAAATQLAPVRKAIAEQDMFVKAQQELANAQIEETNRRTLLENDIRKLDEQVSKEARAMSFGEIMQGGSWGQKIMANIALALGSFSQVYTGSKTNPALDMIDKGVEHQARKDKLRYDQKLALKRELLESGQQKLKILTAQTNNAETKAKLNMMYQQIEAKRQETQAELQAALQQQVQAKNMYSGAPISDEVMATLKPEQQKSIVNINGKRYMASGPDVARTFNEEYLNGQAALGKLKKYQEFVEKGGLRTLGEKGLIGFFRDKGASETLKTAIIGTLRLPFTGPGVLTPVEREDLKNAIGKFGLFDLPILQKDKLSLVIKDIEARMQSSADLAGIKAPVVGREFVKLKDGRAMSREDYLAQIARNRNMSPAQVDEALKKQQKQGK